MESCVVQRYFSLIVMYLFFFSKFQLSKDKPAVDIFSVVLSLYYPINMKIIQLVYTTTADSSSVFLSLCGPVGCICPICP